MRPTGLVVASWLVLVSAIAAATDADVVAPDGANAPAPVGETSGTNTKEGVSLPPMTITAPRLREETLVGPNAQPEWTTRRRFAETRIYVLPPWQLAFYTTWRIQQLRDQGEMDAGNEDDEGMDGRPRDEAEGGGGENRATVGNQLAQEIELGLPYRFQIEYQATGSSDSGEWQFDDQSIELRWALADWGKIPLNPTLFGEWKFRNAEADSYEVKLLLGDEIAPGWHGGINLFFEQQVGDQREQELAASGALSYALIDEQLSLGLEWEFSAEREAAPPEDGSNDFKYKFIIGPSLQWRPFAHFFIDVVPLFGATDDSPIIESFVIVGVDFNTPLAEGGEMEPPAPMRTK